MRAVKVALPWLPCWRLLEAVELPGVVELEVSVDVLVLVELVPLVVPLALVDELPWPSGLSNWNGTG